MKVRRRNVYSVLSEAITLLQKTDANEILTYIQEPIVDVQDDFITQPLARNPYPFSRTDELATSSS